MLGTSSLAFEDDIGPTIREETAEDAEGIFGLCAAGSLTIACAIAVFV